MTTKLVKRGVKLAGPLGKLQAGKEISLAYLWTSMSNSKEPLSTCIPSCARYLVCDEIHDSLPDHGVIAITVPVPSLTGLSRTIKSS